MFAHIEQVTGAAIHAGVLHAHVVGRCEAHAIHEAWWTRAFRVCHVAADVHTARPAIGALVCGTGVEKLAPVSDKFIWAPGGVAGRGKCMRQKFQTTSNMKEVFFFPN